jgi:glycosyltransferase involved in cell wall biosynthesis
LKICLIGGIYGTDPAYRDIVQFTPETILERSLRSRGHTVTALSHYDPLPHELFDVVHVHHLSWGALKALCSMTKARVVITLHALHTRQSMPLCRQLVARYVLAHADALVALSEYEAEQQRTDFNVNPKQQSVIRNGIDFGVFTPAYRNHAPQRPWRLLYVGQLIELKRVDVLLRALSLCPGDIELDLVFHIDTLRHELEALAATLGIASRVHFLGPRTPHQLAQLYQQADVFVLPSASEALPTVITEAMACGTPVIATCVGGIPEQLDGKGILVHPGDAEELAQAIRHILDEYCFYAAQAETVALNVSKRFSSEQMVERHLQLYANLLRSPTAHHGLTSQTLHRCLLSMLESACRLRRKHIQHSGTQPS